MKKNKLMRLASVLLVLTLLSTSVIGGTFAKYITTDSAKDTARVAKFGVVATVTGDLFGTSYEGITDPTAAATNNKIQSWAVDKASVSAFSVSAANANRVVAPGTKNDVGMTFAVKGTPEVSTNVTMGKALKADGSAVANNMLSDIVLKTGIYGIMVPYTGTVTADNVADYFVTNTPNDVSSNFKRATPADLSTANIVFYRLVDVVNVAADYYPITWTYKLGDADAVSARGASALTGAKTAIAGHFNGGTSNNPNTKLDKSATLTWEWKFTNTAENDGTANNTELLANQDTILGDMIADVTGQSSVTATTDAYAETNDFTVVKLDAVAATTGTTIKFVELDTTTDEGNKIVVAYTGNTVPVAPTSASDTPVASIANVDVAVLTAAFDSGLTVSQVD